ncbi:MAG: response regulator, partial [Chloroflexi bacterium]|nr:response regulator [Chloroflexota bacterium]
MTHVLVIDDEVVFHNLVTRALEGYNFQITTADNGTTGLFLARSIRPDIIITDVMMPDIIGYEVVRTLRRDPEFAQTPILMLTAQSGLQDKLSAFESGADDHLREDARMIVVHSLRGGAGSSSLAVNLALGLRNLWHGSTNLVDLTMMAGQVALMLNASLKRTWADIARYSQIELDSDVVNSIISRHECGLDFIAAPTLPTDAE